MVTNDGATILQKMQIENPASKIIIGSEILRSRYFEVLG